MLQSEICSKLHGVLTPHLGEIIGKLIGIPYLRNLTFEIVTNGEPTGDSNERQPFAIWAEIRGDT